MRFDLQLFNDEATEVEEKDVYDEVVDSFNDDIDTPVDKETDDFDTPVETEKVEDEAEVVEEETKETEEVKEDAELFTLKHFEGDKEVTKDELIALGQRGIDYDRVKTQRDEARNDPRILTADKVEQLAELYEYKDINKFVDDLFSSYDSQKADKDGSSAEVVRRERINADKEKELSSKQSELEQQTKVNEENSRFLTKYPNVEVPTEVWKEVAKGTDLTVAYEEHLHSSEKSAMASELEEMKKKMAILEKSQQNATKTKSKSLEGKVDGKGKEAWEEIWDK